MGLGLTPSQAQAGLCLAADLSLGALEVVRRLLSGSAVLGQHALPTLDGMNSTLCIPLWALADSRLVLFFPAPTLDHMCLRVGGVWSICIVAAHLLLSQPFSFLDFSNSLFSH